MSMNSTLNPNVVKTVLDEVFWPSYSIEKHPQIATALTSSVFVQDSVDRGAVIQELFDGVGDWTQTAEEQDFSEASPRTYNQKTFTVLKWAKMVKIPKEYFDDDMHSTYEKMVRSMARRAVTKRDKNAFGIYRNAFTTTLTADGIALCSNSHTNGLSQTVDNLLTGALSESTLNTAITQMLEMVSQDGEIDGFTADTLLVPPAVYKTACEITESELRSGTSDNDMNVYSDKYGLKVYTSPYLGAAAGGSDTAWFLLSTDHSVTRWVRKAVETNLVDYKISDNDVYKYKGSFREVVGVMSYEGVVGSLGT